MSLVYPVFIITVNDTILCYLNEKIMIIHKYEHCKWSEYMNVKVYATME